MEKDQNKRRTFMTILGSGALGTAFVILNPFKLLSKNVKKDNQDIKPKTSINIHPLAVKRNGRN